MLNPQTNTVAVWNNVWAGETVTAQQILDVMLEQEADRSWQRYTKLVEEHLGGWARVRAIEVGGGASTHSLLAASKGASATVLDYSPEALRVVEARCRALGVTATLIEADAMALPAGLTGTFNLAWSFGTAEHFKGADRAGFIKAHADLVEPGGLIVLAVPNKWAVNYRVWMYLANIVGEWPFGLEIPFSRRELKNVIRELGLQLLACDYETGRPCSHKTLGIIRRHWHALYPLAKGLRFLSGRIPQPVLERVNRRGLIAIARKTL